MVPFKKLPRISTRATVKTVAATRKSQRHSDSPPSTPPSSNPGSPIDGQLSNPRNSRNTDLIDPANPNSPYFMHSADHPGLQLTSIRLDGANYDDWNASMKIALDAKNKIGFVDGTILRLDETDQHFRIWSRCNSMVKSWLLNSVSPQIYRSILRMHDAIDIWHDLYERFHMTNLPRTFNLTQEIQDLRQGTMSLSDYYTKLKTLWDQLENTEEFDDPCTCGKAARFQLKTDRAKIVKFLAGLNETYAITRRQIIMKKALPTIAEVYNLLDQDDHQRGFSIVVPPSAFQITENKPPILQTPTPYHPSAINRGRVACSYCNRPGHTADKCYKKHGFTPGFPKSKPMERYPKYKPSPQANQVSATLNVLPSSQEKTPGFEGFVGELNKDQLQHFIALCSSQLQNQTLTNSTEPFSTTSSHSKREGSGIVFSSHICCFIGILNTTNHTVCSQTWIIDSGATNHVSYDRNLFTSLDTSIVNSVNLPNGHTVEIKGMGDIKINDHFSLFNVLFIPDFKLNLLSISCLTSDLGFSVIFDPTSCTIQDPIKGSMIGHAKRNGNLYVMDVKESLVNTVINNTTWHQRLGHPAFSRLDVISQALGTSHVKK